MVDSSKKIVRTTEPLQLVQSELNRLILRLVWTPDTLEEKVRILRHHVEKKMKEVVSTQKGTNLWASMRNVKWHKDFGSMDLSKIYTLDGYGFVPGASTSYADLQSIIDECYETAPVYMTVACLPLRKQHYILKVLYGILHFQIRYVKGQVSVFDGDFPANLLGMLHLDHSVPMVFYIGWSCKMLPASSSHFRAIEW